MKENTKKTAESFVHKRIVIDTSVLIKAFLNEDKSDLVRGLILLHKEQKMALISTNLLIFELLNVLSKKIKDAKLVSESYRKFKDMSISLIEPDDEYIDDAIKITCMRKNISYYDASYHVLAKNMDAIFLTADRLYFEAMKRYGNIELF